MRYAILAIGSPFGGDQIAWSLVEKLGQWEGQAHELAIEKLDRPGASLLEHFHKVDHAILVDAVIGGSLPAAWYDESTFTYRDAPWSNHSIGLAEALALGRILGRLPTLDVLGLSIDGSDEYLETVGEMGFDLLTSRLIALGFNPLI